MSDPVYASFVYEGSLIRLTRRQYDQAVADGRSCGCRHCLACRAREVHVEAEDMLRNMRRKNREQNTH